MILKENTYTIKDKNAFNDRLAKEYGEPYRAHKYTLSEIVKECANVIDQIIAIKGIVVIDGMCYNRVTKIRK